MEVVETSIFTKQVLELLPDDSYRLLQAILVNYPETGPVIQGSGGLRKIRWGASGRGKRGGARVIYYWVTEQDLIIMLFRFTKNEIENLTKDQLKTLRQLVESEFK